MIEFEALQQGEMNVLQYEQKFKDLIRSAPHYQGNEEIRTKKFMRGLRPDI
ncbi:hypothetical protein, partial [Escherichia coli]|uniref:hypothetical protein n=1 Tax=Escherichia coli TaxID=562 RepID=UPI003F466BEC